MIDLTNWINMDETPPIVGQTIRYYFEHTGIGIGTYNGRDEEYGWNMVSGRGGFLAEDGMWWQPLTDGEIYMEKIAPRRRLFGIALGMLKRCNRERRAILRRNK